MRILRPALIGIYLFICGCASAPQPPTDWVGMFCNSAQGSLCAEISPAEKKARIENLRYECHLIKADGSLDQDKHKLDKCRKDFMENNRQPTMKEGLATGANVLVEPVIWVIFMAVLIPTLMIGCPFNRGNNEFCH